MGIVPGNVIPAVERYVISDPLAINFMIFHEIHQVLSKTASPQSPQIYPGIRGLIGTKSGSPGFSGIFQSSSGQKVITSEFNRNPVPSGPNPVRLDFQAYSRGPSGPNSDHLRIQSEPGPIGTKSGSPGLLGIIPGCHRDQTAITSEKNSDPGPVGNRYC